MQTIAHSEAGAAAMPPKLTQRDQLLAELRDGPGTSEELGVELGLRSGQITATLLHLVKSGRAVRRPFVKAGGLEVWLYSAAEGL